MYNRKRKQGDMQKRFVAIWFRYLKTDWFTRRNPQVRDIPFVLAMPQHGRLVITAANAAAEFESVYTGMVVADARAIIPALQVFDDDENLPATLLKGFAEWFIRYSPVVAIDLPDGLIIDASGCTHLWGGEKKYLADIHQRLGHFGYGVRTALADTIGAAWALARFANGNPIIEPGMHKNALLSLPPAALRISAENIDRLEKLGLRQIGSFINMPGTALRRRFGNELLQRLYQALGDEEEFIQPVSRPEPYQERLPCLEPIVSATGIEIALQKLLDVLCMRLKQEGKGIRTAVFKGYRVDGKMVSISIGTNRPSLNTAHLFRLFQLKIENMEPAQGIELFILDAPCTEDVICVQEQLWQNKAGLEDNTLAELLDRIAGKFGNQYIHRYLPAEHYWPERSYKATTALNEKPATAWRSDRPRPMQVLALPEEIQASSLIPDYPPMHFRYKNMLHKIVKADGPERIEQEWWLQEGRHRDYYIVEDEQGQRYWIFRSGHYDAAKTYKWFIHGFFA